METQDKAVLGDVIRRMAAAVDREREVMTCCPNDGEPLRESPDHQLAGCLECGRCGFVQGFGVIVV